MPRTERIRVELGDRSYDVHVGAGLLGRIGELLPPLARSPRAVVITDSNVGPLYAAAVSSAMERAGCACAVLDFPAGESHKNLPTYGQVMDRLLGLTPPVDRGTLVLALGGGVVGDLAGFVAATALRGLDFVNLPTTLLADVDASVGGKTGLDARAGKNLIGAFHQPRAVVIDTAVLKTLPAAELHNGLAECVKHAVIADADLLAVLRARAGDILSADAEALTALVARNVAIKAEVVSADERESGRRAHLNFGHTLGHAIETAAGYVGISHGQAVSLGMTAACEMAARRGLIARSDAQRVREVLSELRLPVRFAEVPGLASEARDPVRLGEVMRRDKKARAGVVRFVLPVAIGKVEVFDDVTAGEVAAAIASLG